MLRKAMYVLICLTFVTSVLAYAADKGKDEETLTNANTLLTSMLSSNSVPMNLLKQAECVVILPGVKKFGIGIGGSGGRGPMLCKTGKNGTWSAPAMYTIGGVSAGMQIGGSSTDYVLLVMTKKGMDALLNKKTKLGNEASAAAGPSGATSTDMGSDLLTYGKSKGLFAGVSLNGATLEPDNDANKRLYDKAVSADEIVVKNSVAATAAGKPLVEMLDKKTATHTAAPKKK